MQLFKFEEVHSIEQIDSFYEIAESIIIRSSLTMTSLVKRDGWIPICIHEDLLNMYEISPTLKKFNYEIITGLAWSRDDIERLATIFDSTKESIGQFVSKQWCSAYLIFSGSPDWIILVEKTLGFCFLYGEKEFLEELIDSSQNEAFLSIEKMIDESRYLTDTGRRHFRDLLHQLRDIYPTLLPGDMFKFEFT